MRSGADSTLGGFGGLFDLKATGYKDPVLVAGNDGVGTKLLIAIDAGQHNTVGIDLVAMCVNDLVVQGAEPLFFLDYFATGKLSVEDATAVIAGIATGCREAGCALIGGETAEMPGLYGENEYDLAGFSVGAVERDQILPRNIAVGDAVIGLPSSGFHSNGYSLIRKIVSVAGFSYSNTAPFDPSITLGEALLTPTRIYIKPCLALVRNELVNGFAHITGGGLTENIPRVLPDDLAVTIDTSAFELPPMMKWLADTGGLSTMEMARTFNCGIGMVVLVSANNERSALETLQQNGEKPIQLGHVIAREGGEQVQLKNVEATWGLK